MFRDGVHAFELQVFGALVEFAGLEWLDRLWLDYVRDMQEEAASRHRRHAEYLLKSNPVAFARWRATERYPVLWLDDMDLSERNLPGIDWRNCVLARTRFDRSHLLEGSFQGAILFDTSFRGARVTSRELQGVDWNLTLGLDPREVNFRTRYHAPGPIVRMVRHSLLRRIGVQRVVDLQFHSHHRIPLVVRVELWHGETRIGEQTLHVPVHGQVKCTLRGRQDPDVQADFTIRYEVVDDEISLVSGELVIASGSQLDAAAGGARE